VRERQGGDVWQHLYDFPSIEMLTHEDTAGDFFADIVRNTFGNSADFMLISTKKHVLTHQIIHVQFFALKNYIFNFNKQKKLNWVSLNKLDELPQPKVIHDFVQEYFKKNKMD